jgi:hypothetical protein
MSPKSVGETIHTDYPELVEKHIDSAPYFQGWCILCPASISRNQVNIPSLELFEKTP